MALAAIVGAASALLTGPGSHRALSGPGVSAASRLTLSAATTGAPGESPGRSDQLNAKVDGVAFPYWGERFGWRASGMRTDTMDGRSVTTVFYSDPHGRRIGYAIVAGTPAPSASGGTVLWHGGTAYRMRQVGGVPVLSWEREGRMCALRPGGQRGDAHAACQLGRGRLRLIARPAPRSTRPTEDAARRVAAVA